MLFYYKFPAIVLPRSFHQIPGTRFAGDRVNVQGTQSGFDSRITRSYLINPTYHRGKASENNLPQKPRHKLVTYNPLTATLKSQPPGK